ncbi:MAG TPA: DUF3800 domain-containing protein [Tepidisphaeraceae bacterium]|jgi:hypothetical protein|nr:DUF3800 domain-containing protein [Tepidisphaeraceae bacterium]
MSWLFFMDESGHDHRNTPYEVNGGIAIHASKLWPFIQALQRLEVASFGDELANFGLEIKGCKLLDKDKFRFANQMPSMNDEERRKHASAFLNRSAAKQVPSRVQFTAYGQACLTMAQGIFQLLRDYDSVLFAAAIPRGVTKPIGYSTPEHLRKDHVFLFERFFYFLEMKKDHGLLVVDETEKSNDRQWVRRLQNYFAKTHTGRIRTQWIVPSPFFVSSEMAQPVQAADLCIYCVNWCFRLPSHGMDGITRPDIGSEFGSWLARLQFSGDCYKDGNVYHEYGIVYVPDPYTPR